MHPFIGYIGGTLITWILWWVRMPTYPAINGYDVRVIGYRTDGYFGETHEFTLMGSLLACGLVWWIVVLGAIFKFIFPLVADTLEYPMRRCLSAPRWIHLRSRSRHLTSLVNARDHWVAHQIAERDACEAREIVALLGS